MLRPIPQATPASALPAIAASALVVSLVVAAVALCCFVLAKAHVIVLVLFAAIILGETARPFVNRLSQHVSRPLSIVLTLFAFAILAIGAVALPIRILKPQLKAFVHSLSGYASEATAILATWLGSNVREQFAGAIAGNAAPIGLGFIEAQNAIASAISVAVLALLMAGFWLSSSDTLRAAALALVPANLRARAQDLFGELGSTLGVYAGGVVVNGAMVALGSITVLSLLHAPDAIVLGLLQGALVAVPYLGTLVAVVIAGGVVLAAQGVTKAAEAVVFLSLMEGFEGSFISPLIFKQRLNLNPLTTVLATGIGGAVLGVPGVVLAIPAAALLQTAFDRTIAPAIRDASTRS